MSARQWFEGEILEWAKLSNDPVQRLDYLHFTLQDRMQLVEITLDPGDDPQVIFEALNHRGVRLAAADLVKNLLFQTVDQQGDGKRAESLLTDVWLPLDSKPWREEVTTGRIKRVLVDLLLAYWLTIQTEQDVLVEHLFADFKRWLLDNGVRAADVMVDIAHHAKTYLAMHELPMDDPSRRLLDHMLATNTTTPWPLLLHLHADPEIPGEQRNRAAAALEAFLVRREVCGLTTKDYNRLFVTVLAAARRSRAGTAGDRVVATLVEQEAESRRWPDDTEFVAALTGRGIYNRMVRARLRALLVAMENGLRSGGKTEPFQMLSRADQRLTVEHLLPQNWAKNWPVSPDGEPEAIERRNDAVHRLGNLTLTTTKLNSSLSNNAWAQKQSDIKRHSLLRLTIDSVLTPPAGLQGWSQEAWSADWDEDRIEIRGLYLAKVALELWPRPEANPVQDGHDTGVEQAGVPAPPRVDPTLPELARQVAS